MAAGTTYTPIATTTLGSAQSSVTFSSISGSYTDLVLIANGSSSVADVSLAIQFNSDTGTNYSTTLLQGNGSAASSARETSATYTVLGSLSTDNTTSIINILNYSNTTTYKTALGRGNVASARVRAYAGLWRSTSAITRIDIKTNDGSNLASGSTFTLYGIKAA